MGDGDGQNTYDGEELSEFLHDIDEADDALASLKGSYMRDCVAPRGRIKAAMGRAKEAGINLVAFREVLAEHRAQRRLRGRLADLDLADRADFEAMREALGVLADTPLGQAAMAEAASDGRADAEALARVGRGGEILDTLG